MPTGSLLYELLQSHTVTILRLLSPSPPCSPLSPCEVQVEGLFGDCTVYGSLPAIRCLVGRLWTFQEAVLATSIIVVCGNASVDWEKFCQVGAELNRTQFFRHAISGQAMTEFEDGFRAVSNVSWAKLFRKIRGDQLAQEARKDPDSPEGSLHSADVAHAPFASLFMVRSANSAETRDRVYGMLSLTSTDFRNKIPVSYSDDPRKLYLETGKACLEQDKTPTYLKLLAGNTRLPGLPTWCSDLSVSVQEILPFNVYLRAGFREEINNQSGEFPNESSSQSRATIKIFSDKQCLEAVGYRADTIDTVVPPGGSFRTGPIHERRSSRNIWLAKCLRLARSARYRLKHYYGRDSYLLYRHNRSSRNPSTCAARNSTTSTYGPAFTREVSEISKYQSNRHHAYVWAQNLRYLVYDDEDDGEDERERNRVPIEGEVDKVNEEEKQMREAIALSLTSEKNEASLKDGDFDQEKLSAEKHPPDTEFASEQEKLDYAIALSLETADETHKSEGLTATQEEAQQALQASHRSLSCDTCKRYSRFPTFKKPTKFRIIQYNPEDARTRFCNHYAALSYCWRSDGYGTSASAEKSYRIRVESQDGNYIERTNRAPDQIIDRAVDAARAAGLRLIWIDQECLPQDNSKEQKWGIQAMDMVYQRGRLTIGLLESIIPKQAQLEDVAGVLYWGVRRERDRKATLAQRRPGVSLQEFCLTLLEFLELLADELWYSKTWILQKAFSSAENLALFFRTAPGVRFHHPPEQVFDRTPDPNWVEGSFNMFVRDILRLIRVSKEFLMSGVVEPETYTDAQTIGLVEHGNEAHTADWYGRAVTVIGRLDRLIPIPAATTNRHAFMSAIGGPNFGPRKTCNAAVSLYFLHTRLNHRPADRLAIVANLCDYEIRLDTTEIEKRFTSLSVCLATLAIINGDLSLLVPGVYHNCLGQAPLEGPSWALPFTQILHSIDTTILRAGYNLSLRNSKRYSISPSGLTIPAALWNVDRMVDLTLVKLQWQSEWKKLSCFGIEVSRLPGETPKQYQDRGAKIIQQAHESKGGSDPSRPGPNAENYEWDFEPEPGPGANVSRVVPADHANESPQVQALLGRIFVDILRYLYHNGEAALANSIWHSIRLDCTSVRYSSRFNWEESNTDSLPDDIADLLGNRALISNLWPALQLDVDGRGTLSQLWVIHRIMKYGFLWIGTYASTSNSEAPLSPFQLPTRLPKPRPQILSSQTIKQVMAFQLKQRIHKVADLTLGESVTTMYELGRDEYIWEREARFRQQVAAFDVDGPCLVATPFDSDMERLPRPSVRSMACAWVVEPTFVAGKDEIGDVFNKEQNVQSGERSAPPLGERLSGEFAGHEKVDVLLGNEIDEHHSKKRRIDKGKGKMEESVREEVPCGEVQQSEVERHCRRLNVLSRVMGLWEIMEEPTSQYTFI